MKPEMLKHLSGEPIGRFPVWAMRQAGRYLPEYRAIRSKHSFWEMATEPSLAAQVSLTPYAAGLPVDGIIFFSDILTLPYGMGIPIEMQEKVGPVVTSPLRSFSDFSVFSSFSAKAHTPYVGQALELIRKTTPEEIALLGFAGAPWTVGSYLAEGKAGRKFEAIRNWMHRDPSELSQALDLLGEATIAYLVAQVHAGAQMVQLFDTWLSEMPKAFFVSYYRPILNRIFREVKKSKVPVIFFSKHAHHLLDEMQGLEMDVLSVDELLPLGEVEARTGGKFSLQGNLDPLLLFSDPAIVRRQTRALVEQARSLKRPALMNLGHGILPGTPVESVRAFFEEARQLWV